MSKINGERGGTRTLDPMIKSHVLYRLSYALTLVAKHDPDGRRPRPQGDPKGSCSRRRCVGGRFRRVNSTCRLVNGGARPDSTTAQDVRRE